MVSVTLLSVVSDRVGFPAEVQVVVYLVTRADGGTEGRGGVQEA